MGFSYGVSLLTLVFLEYYAYSLIISHMLLFQLETKMPERPCSTGIQAFCELFIGLTIHFPFQFWLPIVAKNRAQLNYFHFGIAPPIRYGQFVWVVVHNLWNTKKLRGLLTSFFLLCSELHLISLACFQ